MAVDAPEDFRRAFDVLASWLEQLERSLSPREQVVLQIGLRLSHTEEAAAAGEFARAREHWAKVVELAQKLGTMP